MIYKPRSRLCSSLTPSAKYKPLQKYLPNKKSHHLQQNGIETEQTPRQVLKHMAEVGLMGVCIDPKYGGTGADFVAYALAIEEISAADGGLSNLMAANNSPVAAALQEHGTDWQKEHYLTRLCSGEWLGCIHLTEPHTGSDAAAIRTRAVRERCWLGYQRP